jgi:hypothetical protein
VAEISWVPFSLARLQDLGHAGVPEYLAVDHDDHNRHNDNEEHAHGDEAGLSTGQQQLRSRVHP